MAARFDGGAQRDARHAFDARANGDIYDARLDEVGGKMDGLLAGAALAVNRCGRDFDGEVGGQGSVAGDIERLFAHLHDAARDNIFDDSRVNVGTVDQFAQGGGQKHDRVDIFEGAIALAYGGADGFDDDDITHEIPFLSAGERQGRDDFSSLMIPRGQGAGKRSPEADCFRAV